MKSTVYFNNGTIENGLSGARVACDFINPALGMIAAGEGRVAVAALVNEYFGLGFFEDTPAIKESDVKEESAGVYSVVIAGDFVEREDEDLPPVACDRLYLTVEVKEGVAPGAVEV